VKVALTGPLFLVVLLCLLQACSSQPTQKSPSPVLADPYQQPAAVIRVSQHRRRSPQLYPADLCRLQCSSHSKRYQLQQPLRVSRQLLLHCWIRLSSKPTPANWNLPRHHWSGRSVLIHATLYSGTTLPRSGSHRESQPRRSNLRSSRTVLPAAMQPSRRVTGDLSGRPVASRITPRVQRRQMIVLVNSSAANRK